jgi:hypothetical protein
MEPFICGLVGWVFGLICGASAVAVFLRARYAPKPTELWEAAPVKEIRNTPASLHPQDGTAQMGRIRVGTSVPGAHRRVRGRRPRKLDD